MSVYATVVYDCEGYKYELDSVGEQLWITPIDDDGYSVNKKDFSEFEASVFNFLMEVL
jgi:hypothetical protein